MLQQAVTIMVSYITASRRVYRDLVGRMRGWEVSITSAICYLATPVESWGGQFSLSSYTLGLFGTVYFQ